MKRLFALALTSSLAGCCGLQDCPAPEYADYQAKLVDGDLCCTLSDTLEGGPQQMVQGQSNRGETADWKTNHYSGDDASNSKLEMELSAPTRDVTAGTVSMGAFRTRLAFGAEKAFTLRATFENPTPVPSAGWAFAVLARTGDRDDTPDLTRIQLSVRIRPDDIDARIIERDAEASVNKIDNYTFARGTESYNAIAHSRQPITLRLEIDRQAGVGNASITVGSQVYPVGQRDFRLTLFGSGSTSVFTTAGVAIATDTDWGKKLSIQVTDFRICTSRNNC